MKMTLSTSSRNEELVLYEVDGGAQELVVRRSKNQSINYAGVA